MSYVVQQPRSKTNPTDKHLVVNFEDWSRYAYHGGTAPEVYGEFTDPSAAAAHRDELNAGLTSETR